MCEESYSEDWFYMQGSSQSLVGLAGLVGVPYDTLTLTEFLASPSNRYTSVWFARCLYVNDSRIAPLATRLGSHVAAGGSVFLDSPLGIVARNTAGMQTFRSMGTTFPYLGITDGVWQPLLSATVRTTSSTHKIAMRSGVPAATTITQGIAEMGFETFGFTKPGAAGNDVLLEAVPAAGGAAVPFLVVSTATGGGKVLGASAYSASGAATPFRNIAPAGFYDNRLMPYMVEALAWLVGPDNEPFVGLQLSHAPMTVVARLDGDVSEVGKADQDTLNYLIDFGKRTGVTTVYGIVSGRAETGKTWSQFAAGGPGIQQLGGTIGSHSTTHYDDMSATVTGTGWTTEIAGSLQTIRSRLTSPTFTPDAYAFINPGNPIRNEHYGLFFGAIDLYMTHAYETIVPYATGVMGFGLPAGVAAKPVINNVPASDYQWLFSADWNYTVATATAAQKKLLSWYQDRVGRGVLYNQLWHDYLMSGYDVPVHDKQQRALPLYDVNRDHFEQNRIYAPAVRELIGKMYLAKGIGLTSAMNGDELRATLDTAAIAAAYRDDSAGMGLRVTAGPQPIAAVTLNGTPYYAFTSDTVIVPPAAATQDLGIRFGAPSGDARLTYISKAFSRIAKEGETLTVTLRKPGLMTKFCFGGSPAHVVLSADAFRRSGEEFCGEVRYGAAASAVAAQHVDTGATGLHVTGADRPITSVTWSAPTMTLNIAAGASGKLDLESTLLPESITVNGQSVAAPGSAGAFSITLADTAATTVVLRMPAVAVDNPPPSGTTPPGTMTPAPTEASGCACSTVASGPAPLGAAPIAGLLAVMAGLARAWRRRAPQRIL